MSLAQEFANLFRRDISKVILQLQAFPDEGTLWQALPGNPNTAGNLILHLEGNLREYIGRQLGGIPYQRQRDLEFSSRNAGIGELAGRLEEVRGMVAGTLAALTDEQLAATFPENVLGAPLTTSQFVIHLYGHLNYHLGQIDSIRRGLTGKGALAYPRL
ncbi:MAG: DinB family protein [Acidobacteria bacterium]|nr:DinB family protein [Acidobacteriota bacterium]